MARLKKLRDKNAPKKKYNLTKMYIPGTDSKARDLTDDEMRAEYRKAYVKYKLMGIDITPPEQVGLFNKIR